MTQKEQIADLKEQNEILFLQHQQTIEKLDSLLQKQNEAPKEKEKVGLSGHYQTLVENAVKAPISSLSGLGVAMSYAATTVFPQYAEELKSIETFLTMVIGVSAGGKVRSNLKNTSTPKAPVPEPTKSEEYG